VVGANSPGRAAPFLPLIQASNWSRAHSTRLLFCYRYAPTTEPEPSREETEENNKKLWMNLIE
jgi:hypothetical protein